MEILEGAVDLSFSDLSSSIRGATGNYSTATGYRTQATATATTAMGCLTTASGIESTGNGTIYNSFWVSTPQWDFGSLWDI